MQKFLLLSLVLGFSMRSFGADFLPKESNQEFKCKTEIQKELEKVFSKNQPHWERTADPSFDTQAFRTSTAQVGEWYELQIREKETPKLLFYSSTKTSESTRSKKCKAKNIMGPGLEISKKEKGADAESFSDVDLGKLLTDKKTALIYVWSPRMGYSITEFTRVRALAERRKMEFIPVLDPAVNVNEARAAMKKAGVDIKVKSASSEREPSAVELYKKLNSVELYMRNATLHFPTVYMTTNGKIHDRRLIGVLGNDDLNKSLDEMTGDLK